jgi:hypothetical protein
MFTFYISDRKPITNLQTPNNDLHILTTAKWGDIHVSLLQIVKMLKMNTRKHMRNK